MRKVKRLVKIDTCTYHLTASFLIGTKQKILPSRTARQDTRTDINLRPETKCAFCSESRIFSACPKNLEDENRMDIVKRRRLGFNCIDARLVSQSTSEKRCQTCQRRHHTSICQVMKRNPDTTTTSVIQPETTVFHSVTKTHTCTKVLLKTAISTVCSKGISTDACNLLTKGHRDPSLNI